MTPGPSLWIVADWKRPAAGPSLTGKVGEDGIRLSGQPGFCTNGGPGRSHPARALPKLLEIQLGEPEGSLEAISFVGIFALWAGPQDESPGTIGASIQVGEEDGSFHFELINGRHYCDARELNVAQSLEGDGFSRVKVGETVWQGERLRVDQITIELPPGPPPSVVRFRDLGSPASFAILDVCLRWRPMAGCPFHSQRGGVPLSELGSIIRLRDRVRFRKAIDQLDRSLSEAEDLDEARGEALTFTAVAIAATLELGAPRSMHRVQLEAARRFERAQTVDEVREEALSVIEATISPLFDAPHSPNARLVDRALDIVDRQYARRLTDASVAEQLGLSPSHFRFLFRQATGQPFHKYLVSVRLERARKLLVEQGMAVSDVAAAVGFNALSHFSRAFSQRFEVSPTQIRNAGR